MSWSDGGRHEPERNRSSHGHQSYAAGVGALALPLEPLAAQDVEAPFGSEFPNLDALTTGSWWTQGSAAAGQGSAQARRGDRAAAPAMDVPRDQVVVFALYTVQNGVLKMSAQLFPLKPDEERVARLELQRDGQWTEALCAFAPWRETISA